MKLVCFVVTFVALVSAELETRDIVDIQDRSADLNKLVDHSIPQIAQLIRKYGLDPLNLPRTETKLWVKFPNSTSTAPLIYKADLTLHSGKLDGLSKLKRYGNATITYKDKIADIEIGFEFELLQATYNYFLNMGLFSFYGHAIASTENVRAKINIVFNATDIVLILNKFELQVPGKIQVTFGNNGLLNWIKTAIVNIIIPFYKNTITSAVQEEAANAIRSYFSGINQRSAMRNKLDPIFIYQLSNSN